MTADEKIKLLEARVKELEALLESEKDATRNEYGKAEHYQRAWAESEQRVEALVAERDAAWARLR